VSAAISVQEAYKIFGSSGEPRWKRWLGLAAPANGHTNGHTNGQPSGQAEALAGEPAANGAANGANGVHGTNAANGANGEAQPGATAAPPATNGKGRKPPVVAVNRVSFEVAEGEIFGVLGPNGGGKSTLIRLLCTLLLPDGGTLTVLGHDVVRQAGQVRRLINRVSVEASFFKKLTAEENLIYGARLYGLEAEDIRRHIAEILTRLGLDARARRSPMEELSRGMQQKVAIARALLSRPRVLLLDEPTTGLDPRSKREVQAVVRELRAEHGTTILLTTHDMLEAETLCDRLAIMDRGQVVALGTPAELIARQPVVDGRPATLEDVFLALTGRALVGEDEVRTV
jgi:ABC-2 type transport system ATP-binding protein